jgi:hypothetical protein
MSHVVQKVAGWRLRQWRGHFNVARDREIRDWVMIVNNKKTHRRKNDASSMKPFNFRGDYFKTLGD